jgi:hypothetical protein
MKQKRAMKQAAGVAILAMGIMVSGCTVPQDTDTLQSRGEGTEGTQAAADLEIERAETRMELIALRDRIDARINNVDRHMEMTTVEDDRRSELQEYRSELVRNRERVENELQEVEAAETGAWHDVRTTAERTTQDVEEWFNMQTDRVEGWFQEGDTIRREGDRHEPPAPRFEGVTPDGDHQPEDTDDQTQP